MNENDIYKIAYLKIKNALNEWGYDRGNEKDFTNYVSGITEFCDDLFECKTIYSKENENEHNIL